MAVFAIVRKFARVVFATTVFVNFSRPEKNLQTSTYATFSTTILLCGIGQGWHVNCGFCSMIDRAEVMGVLAGGGKNRNPNFHKKRKLWIFSTSSDVNAGIGASLSADRFAASTRSFGIVHKQQQERSAHAQTLFVGQIARAVQVAQKIPDILEQPYCYCECAKRPGREAPLSCFVDSHAATRVDICQGRALDASQVRQKGYGRDEIRQYIHSHFSNV